MKHYTPKQLASIEALALKKGFARTANKQKFVRESDTASTVELLVLNEETVWLHIYERSEDASISANFDTGDTLADIRSAIKAREGEDVKQPAPRIVIMVSGGNASLIDEESDPAVTVEVRDYDIEGFDGDFEKDSDDDEYRSFTL